MLLKTTLLAPLFAALLLLGPTAGPALSLDPSDGGISPTDQDPEFNDPTGFDEVDEFADAAEEDVDDAEDPGATVVRAGGIVGIWKYTDRHEGRFYGKLFVRRADKRVLVGRVKGIFAKDDEGNREMVGVVLNRNGRFKGILRGRYSENGFAAHWRVNQDVRGKARAKFVCPYGRAGFVGTFSILSTLEQDEP